jgi:hypothetical protein
MARIMSAQIGKANHGGPEDFTKATPYAQNVQANERADERFTKCAPGRFAPVSAALAVAGGPGVTLLSRRFGKKVVL